MRMNEFPSKNENGHAVQYTARARRWVLGVVLATLVAAPLMAQDWSMSGQIQRMPPAMDRQSQTAT